MSLWDYVYFLAGVISGYLFRTPFWLHFAELRAKRTVKFWLCKHPKKWMNMHKTYCYNCGGERFPSFDKKFKMTPWRLP